MKKFLAIILSLAMIFCFCACGGSSESTEASDSDSQESADKAELEIVDSGWSNNDGYIYYSIKIKNLSTEQTCMFPKFRMTAYDENDEVVGTEEEVLCELLPGATEPHAFMGFDVTGKPAKVEFEIISEEDDWISAESSEHPDYKDGQLTAESAKLTKGEYGDNKITGKIVNSSEENFSSVGVYVMFKGSDGKLIGGEGTFVDNVKAGGGTPFEIDVYGDFVTDDFEVWAYPWE